MNKTIVCGYVESSCLVTLFKTMKLALSVPLFAGMGQFVLKLTQQVIIYHPLHTFT